MKTMTELRNMHAAGHTQAGINVRKGRVTNMPEERVLQPLLVTSSAINLATETVRMILKIDDIVRLELFLLLLFFFEGQSPILSWS